MQRIQQRHSSAVNGLNDLIRRILNHKTVPVCMVQNIASNILDVSKVLMSIIGGGTAVIVVYSTGALMLHWLYYLTISLIPLLFLPKIPILTFDNKERLTRKFNIITLTVTSIKCYQCSADKTIDCADLMINQPDAQIQPEECDSVHDAKYCIKSTALNG